jgi:hypothetical protein
LQSSYQTISPRRKIGSRRRRRRAGQPGNAPFVLKLYKPAGQFQPLSGELTAPRDFFVYFVSFVVDFHVSAAGCFVPRSDINPHRSDMPH